CTTCRSGCTTNPSGWCWWTTPLWIEMEPDAGSDSPSPPTLGRRWMRWRGRSTSTPRRMPGWSERRDGPRRAEGVGRRERMMSDLQAAPNYPVIVLHTDDGNGLTAGTGQPMPGPAGDAYRDV